MKPEFAEFVDNTAMQVAAMAPQFMTKADVADDAKAKQSEIFDAQLIEEGKPDKEGKSGRGRRRRKGGKRAKPGTDSKDAGVSKGEKGSKRGKTRTGKKGKRKDK